MTTAVDVARQALVYWGEWRGYPVDQWCQAFAAYYWPWAYQGNEDGIHVYPSAKAAWYATPGPADGTDMNPPPGAFVWWEIGEFWHVGNSAGNGYFVNTSTQGDTVEALDWGAKVSRISSYPGKYLGWTYRNGLNGPYPGLTAYSGGGGGGGGVDYAYGLTTEAQLAAQQALTQLGFYDGDRDGVFGYWSVLAFQEYLGRGALGLLPSDYSYDGIPGYYYGVAVQQLAARYGYTGPIDGEPGEYTSAGLERWAADVLAVSPPTPEPEQPATDPWNYAWSTNTGRFSSYDFPSHKWRAHPISGIVIHHVAGTDGWGYVSNPNDRDSHPTYHIAKDGLLGGVVSPSKRPSSSGNSIDERAITVEIANEAAGGTWPVSDASIESLIELIVWQAHELGYERIVEYRVGMTVGEDEFFVAWHSQFVATACPGPYLLDRISDIVAEANRRLARLLEPEPEEPEEPEEPTTPEFPTSPEEPARPPMTPEEAEQMAANIVNVINDKTPTIVVAEGALNAVITDPEQRKKLYNWHTLVGLGLKALKDGAIAAVVAGFAFWAILALTDYPGKEHLEGWIPFVVGIAVVFSFIGGVYNSLGPQISSLASANTPAKSR